MECGTSMGSWSEWYENLNPYEPPYFNPKLAIYQLKEELGIDYDSHLSLEELQKIKSEQEMEDEQE